MFTDNFVFICFPCLVDQWNLIEYQICNKSYWKALQGGEVVSVGLHFDTFTKNGHGNWLCQKRVIQHVWTKDDGHITIQTK